MDPVVAACRDILRTEGPMALTDLAGRVAADGHVVGEDPDALDDLLFPWTEPEWSPTELADGRLADPEELLEGLVLTTRLDDEHVRAGQPTFSPDLDPLLELLRPGIPLPLAGGGQLDIALDDGTWDLSGPEGWMPGEAGQLLTVRLSDGRLHVDAVDAASVADDPGLVDELAITYDEMREFRAGVEVPDLVLDLRARVPDALSRPHAPLGELLVLAGLARHGDWVVYPEELNEDGELTGSLADAFGSTFRAVTAHLVGDHGMSEEQADDFVLLTVLTTGVRLSPPDDLDDEERQLVAQARVLAGDPADPDPDEEVMDLQQGLPRLAELFADDEVAQAVPHDLLAQSITAPGPFAVIAKRVAKGSRDRIVRSNAWWLYAHALEFLDRDGVTTERALRRALEASRDHSSAAIDLTWHLDDRGEAGRAVGILAEHGLGDSDWADDLRSWAAPGPTSAGRNDPCPCGSGRKHKICCEPRNGWPLLERIDWVFGKLTRFAARPANVDWLANIAMHGGMELDRPGLPEDAVIASICLFEGGLIEDFCRLRGPLVPADELDLLRSWAEVTAGAYELVEVEPGTGMTVLDLTTGDRHEVAERSASEQLAEGQLLLTWLIPYPDGTTRIALGAGPIPVQHRRSLLALLDAAPDAENLASWYGGLAAPPLLHNTDGDPLMVCRITMDVPDEDAARQALATVGTDAATITGRETATLEAEDDAFHLLVEDGAARTLIGTIRVDAGQLVLEANSEARVDGLAEVAMDRIEAATVVEDVRRRMEDLVDDDGTLLDDGGPAPRDILEDLDPEERQVLMQGLDAWMAEQEERWCDESVPALGGLTPRQAAADPTRRAELRALLDELPAVDRSPGQPRGMDPDRLRHLLGLTT